MTPAQKLGYKVGDTFKVICKQDNIFSEGSIVELIADDSSIAPKFRLIEGYSEYGDGKAYLNLDKVERYNIPNKYPTQDFKINLSNMTEAEKEVTKGWLVEIVNSRGDGHVINIDKSNLLYVSSEWGDGGPNIEWEGDTNKSYFNNHKLPELTLTFSKPAITSWSLPEEKSEKELQLEELVGKLQQQLEEAQQKLEAIR